LITAPVSSVVCPRDGQFDEHGDLDIDRPSLIVKDLDLHVLLEVVDVIAQLALVERDLLIARCVHEIAVLVGFPGLTCWNSTMI
jgi:hypothetical protein